MASRYSWQHGNTTWQEVAPVHPIMFNFRPEVSSERQEAVLKDINTWGGIRQAGHLNPEAKHPLARRMSYAYVGDEADPHSVVKRLRKLPEIESVSIPAERGLIY